MYLPPFSVPQSNPSKQHASTEKSNNTFDISIYSDHNKIPYYKGCSYETGLNTVLTKEETIKNSHHGHWGKHPTNTAYTTAPPQRTPWAAFRNSPYIFAWLNLWLFSTLMGGRISVEHRKVRQSWTVQYLPVNGAQGILDNACHMGMGADMNITPIMNQGSQILPA
jgi:hypothetical protein